MIEEKKFTVNALGEFPRFPATCRVVTVFNFSVPVAELDEQQRAIAEFLSRNADRVAYLTVEEIASELSISIASVSRFARVAGYKGFKELKSAFREQASPTPRRKVESRVSAPMPEGVLSAVVTAEVEHLRETAGLISPEQLEAATTILTASRRLFVYAAGPNEALGHLIRFRFNRFGYDVRHIGRDNERLAENVAHIRGGDSLLAYGFFRESTEVSVLFAAARPLGCGTVLVTDLRVSGMAERADVTLRAERGPSESYHSLVAPIAVTDALILSVARRLGEEAADSLDAVARARTEIERLRARM